MTKTFLLGLGAQKAGTTWLHDYLTTLDGVDMGFMKEYHFLDVNYREGNSAKLRKRGFKRKVVENARQLLLDENYYFGEYPNVWVRLAWHSQPSLYFEYFRGLVRQEGVFLTGDLTPDHSILGANELKDVKHQFEARGIVVKPVFLMRDPVERIWSAIRMNRRKGKAVTESDDEKEILRRLKINAVMERSSYDKTFEAMDAAFGVENCFIGLYEDLFTEREVMRICQYLDVRYSNPDFDKRVNTTQKNSSVSEATVKIVANHLHASYETASSLFDRKKILEVWPSARHVF